MTGTLILIVRVTGAAPGPVGFASCRSSGSPTPRPSPGRDECRPPPGRTFSGRRRIWSPAMGRKVADGVVARRHRPCRESRPGAPAGGEGTDCPGTDCRVRIVGVEDGERVVDAGLGERVGLLPGVAVLCVARARGRYVDHRAERDGEHEEDSDRHDERDSALVLQARENSRAAHGSRPEGHRLKPSAAVGGFTTPKRGVTPRTPCRDRP